MNGLDWLRHCPPPPTVTCRCGADDCDCDLHRRFGFEPGGDLAEQLRRGRAKVLRRLVRRRRSRAA